MKLTKEGDSYYTNSKKGFEKNPITNEVVKKSFDFSLEMVFGDGHHRTNRSGGELKRKKGELFCNTFQGKLSEIILQNIFTSHNLECSEPDYSIMGEGEWDDVDLVVNNNKINIKSCAHFSNLLLLETKDWDKSGNYIPNKKLPISSSYNYFILIRISPDIKSIFRKNELFYSNTIELSVLQELISPLKFYYDIGGVISHLTLQHIITNNYVLPKNSKLNGSIKMDAENYYVQCGNMKSFDSLLKALQTSQVK